MATDMLIRQELAFDFLHDQPPPAEAAHPRGHRDPRAVLHADGPPLPRGRARDDGRVRRCLKFAGGSFTLMPEQALREIIDLAHEHDVLVSTGGFIEHVLTQGAEAVDATSRSRGSGFDIVEVSAGFITIPTDDMLRLVERVQQAGLQGQARGRHPVRRRRGDDPAGARAEGTRDVGWAIELARRFLDAGAYMIMIESEGITEKVTTWRTDVVARSRALGPGEGHVRGRRSGGVRLVRQELRARGQPVRGPHPDRAARVPAPGIWGTKSLWGRVLTYPEGSDRGSRGARQADLRAGGGQGWLPGADRPHLAAWHLKGTRRPRPVGAGAGA